MCTALSPAWVAPFRCSPFPILPVRVPSIGKSCMQLPTLLPLVDLFVCLSVFLPLPACLSDFLRVRAFKSANCHLFLKKHKGRNSRSRPQCLLMYWRGCIHICFAKRGCRELYTVRAFVINSKNFMLLRRLISWLFGGIAVEIVYLEVFCRRWLWYCLQCLFLTH